MAGSTHSGRGPLFTLDVTPLRLALGLVALAALVAIPAVVVGLAVGGDSQTVPAVAGATPVTGASSSSASLVPGATIGSGAARVVVVNSWGGPPEPNVVVSVGAGGGGQADAWRFILDDGTALSPTIADWPNGEAYLRLERGVPVGRRVTSLSYEPGGGASYRFEYR